MTRHLVLAALLCTVACDRAPDSPPAPATPTTAPAASTPAVAAAPSAPARPPAPELPPLTLPGGPTAADNVKIDVDAAMSAKDCKIVEGRLGDCPAVAAYRTASNDFVSAKAPDHVRTIFNLLGAEQPAVRMLVLDADPVHYVSVYQEEREKDPTLYEPLLAAALREENPDLRGSFAFAVARVPVYQEHRRLVPYLGAIGERYNADEYGSNIVDALAQMGEDCKECGAALVGIAQRNPDARMRIAAMDALDDRESTPADLLCTVALASLDVEDGEPAAKVVNLFVREDPSCVAQWPAWLEAFEAKTKAGVPPAAWLDVASGLLEDERGKPHVARIRAAAKALLAKLPEDAEQRYRVENLATES
jgi:hypothetical protein